MPWHTLLCAGGMFDHYGCPSLRSSRNRLCECLGTPCYVQVECLIIMGVQFDGLLETGFVNALGHLAMCR